MVLRVCISNIHAGAGAQGRPALATIADTLTRVKADIVLLQEGDRFLPRSRFADQARVIGGRLGAHVHFYARLRFGRAGFDNAILSPHQCTALQRVVLAATGGEPRAAPGVEIECGLSIWNTHLGLKAEWRRTQLASPRAAIGVEGAVLVGGDFHAALEADEIQESLADTGLVPGS